ncbi:DUF4132 domain-containing protein [Glycomyces sp. TRM65418]|uniref:DUF4132 domain-containing protein n=1 Tax=Glycomyces sp. TRM65418 TaxID=2867006 RepID=UPI001CE5654C|nr:DUF4132 domain-containing protein [Glycomyces sp. TRM65418]MCC3765911.1 DUF4132 domain-containing protein [Glycomyces sp. TRM65418]QZD55493.1 DUF4132 domain-containing protein [Glycomyces sp. TRM65418]
MTQSETHPEDRLRLPEKWRRHVLPRRGRDLADVDLDTKVDPGSSEALAERITEQRTLIDEGIGKRRNANFAPAVTDHLQGRPNPSGAAALMHLLDSTGRQTVPPAARLRHLDAWITDHGLAFAAVALVESATIHNRSDAEGERSITEAILYPCDYRSQPESWRQAQPAAHRIRSLLASVPEPAYREVVAAVDAHRTDKDRRIGAAILLPTEADWVREAFMSGVGHLDSYRCDDWMRWSFAGDPQHLDLLDRGLDHQHADARSLAPLIAGAGTVALPLLTRVLDQRFSLLSKPARSAIMTAIGLLPSDDATGYLVDRLERPGTLTVMTEVAERFPQRTLRVIAARAAGAEPDARTRLAGLVKSSPALAAALDDTDEPVRRAVATLIDAPDTVPDAPADALPPLLVAPPWKTKRRKAVVIEGLARPFETRVVWADADETRRWATLRDDDPYRKYDAGGVDHFLSYIEEHPDYDHLIDFLSWAPVEDAEPVLERWRGTARHPSGAHLMRLLGRFGARVADRVLPHLKGRTALAEVLIPIQNPATARIAADWLARSKSLAPVAMRWFDRHADAAAHLLIPEALGGDGGARRAANAALRHLSAVHGAETVTAAAKEYGEAAAAAIDALIATDPLDPPGARIPKPPAWANPAMLPQVLLKGRQSALPLESVGHLLTVLALDSPELPYAGVEVVIETCDPASLTRFSWALFALWTAVGAPSKDGWALTQLTRFADDGTVRELAALTSRWPGEGQHKRAVTGLQVLGAIGSETSLRALHQIARKVRFRPLQEEAGRQIETVADRLGLTTEQLADRLVPDFGLDREASLVLDYGPRRFKVGFDEQLQPFVTDADGEPLKRLPKPSAQDDAETAEEAYDRFMELKRELRKVAKEQVRRLERAMVEGRAWTVPEFKEFFADHPLMWHLARRLVWSAESGGEPFGFRLAEDRTVADVEDDACDLPDDALIRLAHPVALGDRLAAWAGIFADYAILQPFAQLSRPILAFTDQDLETGRLARFEGATIQVGPLLGLIRSGWRRGPSDGLWVSPGLHYALPGGGFVVVALDPGIDGYLGHIDTSQPDQTVRGAYLSATADYAALGERRDHPTDIDPVAASEVLRALTRITRTA